MNKMAPQGSNNRTNQVTSTNRLNAPRGHSTNMSNDASRNTEYTTQKEKLLHSRVTQVAAPMVNTSKTMPSSVFNSDYATNTTKDQTMVVDRKPTGDSGWNTAADAHIFNGKRINETATRSSVTKEEKVMDYAGNAAKPNHYITNLPKLHRKVEPPQVGDRLGQDIFENQRNNPFVVPPLWLNKKQKTGN